MKEIGSFQKVIDLTYANGVGIKKFIFRANRSYDEIINMEQKDGEDFYLPLEEEDWRSEILIIKFSDGISHIGTLCLTREDIERADAGYYHKKPSYFFEITDLFDLDLRVLIQLKYNVYSIADGTVGDAYVEAYPKREKLKEWFEEDV